MLDGVSRSLHRSAKEVIDSQLVHSGFARKLGDSIANDYPFRSPVGADISSWLICTRLFRIIHEERE
jgi:hypothetical protein